jgi:KAP-like P-loop domain-containing protein
MATATPEPSAASDWRPEFIRKLNNRPVDGNKSRTHGLLVAVKGSSLAPVQEACAGQSYNHCLTARYAVTGTPAIGSVMHAFANDLSLLTASGSVKASLTARSEGDWPEFARRVLPRVDPLEKDVTLGHKLFEQVSSPFDDTRAPLRKGQRLVLLIELAPEAFDPKEWDLARDKLFVALPERVVIVIADPHGRLTLPDGEDATHHAMELPAPRAVDGTAAQTYVPAALASDVPANDDRLGLERHFNALARLLLHHETGRLTLAVEGEWGKGKSSFMQFLENTMVDAALARHGKPPSVVAAEAELARAHTEHEDLTKARELKLQSERHVPHPEEVAPERHEATQAVERAAVGVTRAAAKLRDAKRKAIRDDLVVLHFNPWGYAETGQIWAGLAHRLTTELRDTLTRRERIALRIRYARERKAADLWTAAITVLLAVALTVAAAIGGVSFTSSGNGGILYAGSLVLLALIFWRAARGTKPVVDWVSARFRPREHATGMGYQHEVIQDLVFYADGVRRGREQCRMIVFIDDLDRCSDEQILEFMGAINLVLVSSGFYVVLGIDTRMIRTSVRAQYKDKSFNFDPRKDIADVYLEKIVQIAYRVPTADAASRYGSLSELFSPTARLELELRRAPSTTAGGAWGELDVDLDLVQRPEDAVARPISEQPVEDTADELQAFLDYQSLLPSNPRELKRMVNVHRLAKMLLQGEQTAWPPEEQRLLVMWIALCFRWPVEMRTLVDDRRRPPSTPVLAHLGPISDEEREELGPPEGGPTLGAIRNLGLDEVVELCGVLPSVEPAKVQQAAPAANGADAVTTPG